MISLPGLLTHHGEVREDAREVLTTFAGAMKDGLLPNDFGAEGYNTIDAALWFFWAVYKYWSYSGDGELIRQLFPTLRAILRRYAGETPGSYFDEDALIASSPASPGWTLRLARCSSPPGRGRPARSTPSGTTP